MPTDALLPDAGDSLTLDEADALPTFSGVTGGEFSADGRRFVFAHSGGWAELWDAQAMRRIARLAHDKAVNAVRFHPHSSQVATASRDGTVRFWEAETGAWVKTLEHANDVTCLAFAPDGRLATGSHDRITRIWDLGGGAISLRKRRQRIMALAFTQPGRGPVLTQSVPAWPSASHHPHQANPLKPRNPMKLSRPHPPLLVATDLEMLDDARPAATGFPRAGNSPSPIPNPAT